MSNSKFVFSSVMAAAIAMTTTLTSAQTAATADKPAETSSPLAQKYMKLTNSKHKTFNVRIPQIIKEVENLPKNTTGTIVMLGDSITQGFFNKDYMPKKIDDLIVVNEGISGDQIDRPDFNSGVTHRVGLVADAKPAIVFVMIGINDFWGGKETPEQVLPEYENMFKMLKAEVPNAHFVLQSVLPTAKANAYMNPSVDKLNEKIKELAAESGDTYLDLHPAMSDEKGELKAEFTGDGVHLTKPGYDAWLKELQATVPKVLKQ